jgi:hypothetical protein
MKNKSANKINAQKCIYRRDDGTKCSSYAQKDKQYCWRHSPEISEKEKRSHSARGGKARMETEAVKLPPFKISEADDVVKLLCDTLNRMRNGTISQKFAASTAYVSMTLLLAMKEAEAAKERKRIEELKAEGLWPEPVIPPREYVYTNKFYLDNTGKRYYAKKDQFLMYKLKPEDESETEQDE